MNIKITFEEDTSDWNIIIPGWNTLKGIITYIIYFLFARYFSSDIYLKSILW